MLRWRLSNELKWGWVPKYYPSTSRPPGQRPSSNFSSGAVATFLVAVASGQSIGGCLVISSNSEYFGLPPKHPWVARVSCLYITTVQQQKSSLLVLSFSVNHCPILRNIMLTMLLSPSLPSGSEWGSTVVKEMMGNVQALLLPKTNHPRSADTPLGVSVWLCTLIWTIQVQEILYMDHCHGLKIICEFEWSAWFVQECLRIDRYRYDCIETPIVWPGKGLLLYCMARSGIVIPLYCMARSGIGVGVSLYGQVCKQR